MYVELLKRCSITNTDAFKLGRSKVDIENVTKTRGEIIEELFEFDKTPFTHNLNLEKIIKN